MSIICDSCSTTNDLCTKCAGYFRVANAIFGVKSKSFWKSSSPVDRYENYTYFILDAYPDSFIDKSSRVELDSKEFVEFWHQLDDRHKERRLLVNAIALSRDYKSLAEDGRLCSHCNEGYAEMSSTKSSSSNAIVEAMEEFMRTFRRLFITDQYRKGKFSFEYVVDQFQQGVLNGNLRSRLKCKELFGRAFDRFGGAFCCAVGASIKSKRPDDLSTMTGFNKRHDCCVEPTAFDVLSTIFETFVEMYGVWKSTSCDKGKRRLLRKLRECTPRWSDDDRAVLAVDMESKVKCRRGSYIGHLVKEIGLEKFKLLAFGEEKLCAACNRSSFKGEKKLLACRLCHEENIRPKAQYCNVECQKRHWPLHKVETHKITTSASRAENDSTWDISLD